MNERRNPEFEAMSIGPGYACVSCKTYLRPRKNDITVLQQDSEGHPYKLWCADLWECPDCGTQVILGYGENAFSEHYEDDFKRLLPSATHTIEGPMKALT